MHPDTTQQASYEPLQLLFMFPGLRAGGCQQSVTTVCGYHDCELVFLSFCLFVYSTFSPDFINPIWYDLKIMNLLLLFPCEFAFHTGMFLIYSLFISLHPLSIHHLPIIG